MKTYNVEGWNKEETQIVVNALCKQRDRLVSTNKRYSNTIIKLHEQIAQLKQQLSNAQESSGGYESFGAFLADH